MHLISCKWSAHQQYCDVSLVAEKPFQVFSGSGPGDGARNPAKFFQAQWLLPPATFQQPLRRLSLLFSYLPTVSLRHLPRPSGISILSHTSSSSSTPPQHRYFHLHNCDCSAGHLTNTRRAIHWKQRASGCANTSYSGLDALRATKHPSPFIHRHAAASTHVSITTDSLH